MSQPGTLLAAAQGGDEGAFRALVSPHERELRAYCYRMAGVLQEADDLLQEIWLRAWRGLAAFEGRSSLRTWLYRVAWSVCADALEHRAGRSLVADATPPADPAAPIPPPRVDAWLGPCPASLYAGEEPSPEARYSARESVALAFLAALQLLPPRQRATLLACEVLGCTAEECAAMLGVSVPSVTSALQRAREALEARSDRWHPRLPDEESTRVLLARYVQAWERADVTALVSLLHEDATLAMPPLPFWLRGAAAIGSSIGGMVFTPGAAGTYRLLSTEANGLPAFAAYQRGDGEAFEPRALHLIEVRAGRIAAMTAFLDPALFPAFGLPAQL